MFCFRKQGIVKILEFVKNDRWDASKEIAGMNEEGDKNMSQQMSKQQQILRCIMENNPISKRKLQTMTGISWGMISNIIRFLEEERYIVPCMKESCGVGRKADKYDISSLDNYCIGIDFSQSGLVAVVIDMKGRVVEQTERIFEIYERDYALQQIFEVTDLLMEHHQNKKIRGIGFSMQGITDICKGVSELISAIKDWVNVPLKDIMEERYGVRTFLEHDANCIMGYERFCGCMKGRDVTEAILVTHDARIGAGMSVLTRGQICRGNHGMAGEIGCMPIDITEDGKFRYMEGYLVANGILKAYYDLTGNEVTYSEFEQLLQSNDKDAIQVIKQIGRWIGWGVGTACNFLNPQICILHMVGGDGALLYSVISEILKLVNYDKSIEIRRSDMGQEGKAIGAGLVASEHAIRKL